MFIESASLILKSASKILMIKRRPRGSFGSFTVFPGGIVAHKDNIYQENTFKFTAVRETMEETGLVLTRNIKCLDLSSRNELDYLKNVDMETMNLISTWITPPNEPKRFHTRFYLKVVDDIPMAIPDGDETVQVFIKSIPELLQDFRNGEISLMPPQWILLNILNGDIQLEKFGGIVDPERIYKSDEMFILVLPGDYQHSKSSKRQFRIIAELRNGRAINYTLIDNPWSV